MHHPGGSLTFFCVLVTTTAVAVTGKPAHNCFLDDYSRAMLSRYYSPAGAVAVNSQPTFDYGSMVEAAIRLGRSNDDKSNAAGKHATPTVAVGANAPQPVTLPPAANLFGYQVAAGPGSNMYVTAPCKSAEHQPPPPTVQPGNVNDTSSAITVDKLVAYYEQLRGQQELLARQQLQQQIYEQQQRRQNEYMMVQQQIQQQYYQQQQHALYMLEQMRKSPAFVNQLTAYFDHNNRAGGYNATSVATAASPAAVLTAPAAVEKDAKKVVREKDQVISNHERNKEKLDAAANDNQCSPPKHLEPRQATTDDDLVEDRPTFEDDQTPPILEKVYSMLTE